MKRIVALGLFSLIVAGCASFGKFSPGTSEAVGEACRELDSGNPVIGTLCLTSQEIISIFSHVKATRKALRAPHGTNRQVDICEAMIHEDAPPEATPQ